MGKPKKGRKKKKKKEVLRQHETPKAPKKASCKGLTWKHLTCTGIDALVETGAKAAKNPEAPKAQMRTSPK